MMCWVSMVISWGLGTLAAWVGLKHENHLQGSSSQINNLPEALGKH